MMALYMTVGLICFMALGLGLAFSTRKRNLIKHRALGINECNGKIFFVMRINSDDFLFCQAEGTIDFISKIESTGKELSFENLKVGQDTLELLDLERAGTS